MIRYHLKEDPDKLSDQEWADRLKELAWLRDQERKRNPMGLM